MFKQIICICILAIIYISSINAQSCLGGYPYQCVEEGMECNQNRTCTYGLSCRLNPLFLPLDSTLADIGTTSFEPIPQYICQRLGRIGEQCKSSNDCLDELSCYVGNESGYNETCQLLDFAQLGADCSFDRQCYDGLKCDAFERICVADLSDSQIQNGYQCDADVHCRYGFQCNYTTQLCVPRASVGQQCGNVPENPVYVICENDLLCNIASDGNKYCVTPFSIQSNETCTGIQILNGENGFYVSPCVAGTVCQGGVCTAPEWSLATENCNDPASVGCKNYETCYCKNGTYATDAVGQCVPYYVTDSTTQNDCAKLTTDLLACAKEHECADFSLYLEEYNSGIQPDSCLYQHCSSEICDIQGKCIPVNPVAPPSCIDRTQNELGVCQTFSSATSISVSGSLLVVMVVLAMFL